MALLFTRGFRRTQQLVAFTVPPLVFARNHPGWDEISVNALVQTPSNDGTKVLLIQRSPACSPEAPYKWEMPSGACQPSDRTILESVQRMLYERTGLRARHITSLEKSETIDDFSGHRHRRILSLTFVVETIDHRVVLDRRAHMAYKFATREEVMGSDIISEDHKALIVYAFDGSHQEDAILWLVGEGLAILAEAVTSRGPGALPG